MDKKLNFVHYNVNLGRICLYDKEGVCAEKEKIMSYFHLMKCMEWVTVL